MVSASTPSPDKDLILVQTAQLIPVIKAQISGRMISQKSRDELSTSYNPKVKSRCLSAPDATSLHHCLQNHYQYFTFLS